jgi:cytochrome d ubiquinol oxidase subunit II
MSATLVYVPRMSERLRQVPELFAIAILHMLAVANIPREVSAGRDFRAFLSSCAAMATLMALYGLGTFPNLLYSDPDPKNSLTIYNGASSAKTLRIMLIMAGIGVPVVLTYTATIYWIFRGKVKLDRMSY